MKVILFPYDMKNSILAEYSNLLSISVEYFLYPSEVNLQKFGSDIFHIIDTNRFKNRITDEMLDEIDALCLVDSLSEITETEILKVVTIAAKKGKNIILASYSCLRYQDKIQAICDEQGVQLILYYNLNFNNQEIFSGTNIEIDTPVITIMGLLPMTQKFDLQLYLRKNFLDRNYKVSQIGTRPTSELFGFHALPEYLFTNKYSDVEKIIVFNNFIKNIEKEEKPDVIIIGIPDAIIPFSKKHNFSFGIYAYEILSAIHPDFAFVNLPAGNYNQKFLDEISQMCLYKFNVEVDAFLISKYAPISNSLWTKDLAFALMDETQISFEGEKAFCYLDLNANRIYELVESKLGRYGRFKQY